MATFRRDAEQIHELYVDRQKARGKVIRRMEEVRDSYNGDVVIPLPEMDKEQGMYVANLLQQGLDHYGRRISSVIPELECPPVNDRTESSRKKAEVRRRANLSWWESSNMRLMLRRRARWLVGYASAPVVIRPDYELGIPKWETRNPLGCYPGPTINPDDLRPMDTIFATKKPLGWIRRLYPYAGAALVDNDCSDDKMITVLEYNDEEQISLVACGSPDYYTTGRWSKAVLLERVPNLTDLPLAIVPGRVTLDRPTGQFDGIIGMLQMQAKLMALEVMAVQRGVFPDTYLVSRPNETAKFISGPHPGWTGKINEIEGGDIREVTINPGYATNPTIDRIERAARLEGGISPEFGGESGSNIRTGRRGDAILSAMVDFPVQEAQETLAAALEEENRSATQVAKAYFGDRKVSVYVKWKGAKGPLDYTPDQFDSEYTVVQYPMAGADVQNLTIGVGQLIGTEMMSKKTGRRLHPWIDDPELEGDRVKTEGMEAAVLGAFQQKAAAGEIPINDVARVHELVEEQNVPLYKAILKAQQEAQERQAAMAPESGAPPEQLGVDPRSPEAQPGLALPGQGAEAGLAIPEAPPSLDRLGELMRDLRATAPRAAVG